jgi:hypothetical protein
LDVAQAETQVNSTAAQIPALESFLKQAAYRLDVLIGSQPGALWEELSNEKAIPALPPEVLVGLSSELLRRRPGHPTSGKATRRCHGRGWGGDGGALSKIFSNGSRGLAKSQRQRLVYGPQPILVDWADHQLAYI